jgi:hypothetical protein
MYNATFSTGGILIVSHKNTQKCVISVSSVSTMNIEFFIVFTRHVSKYLSYYI